MTILNLDLRLQILDILDNLGSQWRSRNSIEPLKSKDNLNTIVEFKDNNWIQKTILEFKDDRQKWPRHIKVKNDRLSPNSKMVYWKHSFSILCGRVLFLGSLSRFSREDPESLFFKNGYQNWSKKWYKWIKNDPKITQKWKKVFWLCIPSYKSLNEF